MRAALPSVKPANIITMQASAAQAARAHKTRAIVYLSSKYRCGLEMMLPLRVFGAHQSQYSFGKRG
jgi:hypothetical protein